MNPLPVHRWSRRAALSRVALGFGGLAAAVFGCHKREGEHAGGNRHHRCEEGGFECGVGHVVLLFLSVIPAQAGIYGFFFYLARGCRSPTA
jgi:hypothetical protein